MDVVPKTRYVAVGDADVAYQVLGEGPDLLYFNGLGSHVELLWELPPVAEFHRRLASFSRLITFDRRGTGASDAMPPGEIATWEQWTEDVAAVLDAAGSERPAILAAVDAGPIAVLFAATNPERVNALGLMNTTARYLVADDYPIGQPNETAELVIGMVAAYWGSEELLQIANPEGSADPEHARIALRLTRSAATPRSAAAQFRYILTQVDVRDVLPLVHAPTLVMHNRDNPLVPASHGRHIADHIAGARFVELPAGGLNVNRENEGMIFDEVAEFLTGERPGIEVDRVLASVLVTDIVGSTQRAAALGDRRWRTLLDAHNRAVRDALRSHRGREVNTTGDGFLAVFDGPARAIRCAKAIAAATKQAGVDVRMGLHTGECDVRESGLSGLAVHISARIGSLAQAGEVLVSGTVRDLVVGSGIEFISRGEHELRGVPGTWKLFAVAG